MGTRGGRGEGTVSRREGPGKAERGGDGQGAGQGGTAARGRASGSGGSQPGVGGSLGGDWMWRGHVTPLLNPSGSSPRPQGWGQGCFCGTHPRPPSLAFASLSRKQRPLGYPQPSAVRGTEAWRVGGSGQP